VQQITSLMIEYKHVEGWHVFTSKDLPGLYVASMDARSAFEDIPTAIQKLLELNDGIKCKVEQELSFEEFLRRTTKKAPRAAERPPAALQNHRYAVYAC
jgi:hypothetical protein